MKSICLVVPYFGQWPRHVNLYLETCRYNPTIDWLFFADCVMPNDVSQNIKFFKMDLQIFNSLASKKLGLKINLKNVYKLCDFRPAYGIIFEDYLNEYDFWGYADIDVIYGDIRRFLTDDILGTYDIISARKEFLAGHFTLYRNCDRINRLYEKATRYKMVFSDVEKHYSFDECGGQWHRLFLLSDESIKRSKIKRIKFSMYKVWWFLKRIHRYVFDATRKVEDMTECVKRLEKKGEVKSLFRTIAREDVEYRHRKIDNWKLRWDKGKLMDTQTGDELMYFHLMWLKTIKQFTIPQWHRVPESFFIGREGFSESKDG
ncbi:MAG: hypothetical protein JSW40_03605 [Candidatus Omnitrophota bacterium]|nr:MAG: hypothetical protein JSW40_03605 [Candidatus Omnitrophota bacterium]